MLGWTPRVLMKTTLPELTLAMRGYERAHGIDPDKDVMPEKPTAMSRARLVQLVERYG